MDTGKFISFISRHVGRERLAAIWKRRPQRTRPAPGTISPGAKKAILAATAGVVTAVASFAGIQSYSHIYWLAATHRQDRLDSALAPLSVDGLIVAFSLVILFFSVTGRPVPFLARCALWLGVGVTVAANVAFGIPAGIIGALVSAWPAVAFVLSAEGLMILVRAATGTRIAPAHSSAPEPGYDSAAPVPVPVPGGALRTFEPAPAAPVLDTTAEPASVLASAPAQRGRTQRTRQVQRTPNGDSAVPDWATTYPGAYANRHIPSIRVIRDKMGVGQSTAQVHQAHYRAQLDAERGRGDDAEQEGEPAMGAAS